jgi:aspartate aminotransferase
LQPSPEVYEAFRVATTGSAADRFAYMPNLGHPPARERVAEDVAFDGVSANCVALTCGAAGAICIALRSFVQPGDEVIGIAPYFPEFRLYAETSSAIFIPAASGIGGVLNIEAVEAALTPRTGAVIVNGPSNPTGHVLTESELRDLAALLNTHNSRHTRRVLLIVDEVYHRIIFAPAQRAEALAHYEHCVLARSFSKDVGIAGERIGYLALHPSMASPAVERGLEMSMRALGFVNAPATAQLALLNLPSWEIDVAPYRKRHDRMLAGLHAAGLQVAPADGALYLWVRSPWPDTLAFIHTLAERHVLFTPGIAFGVDDHFRICFSVPLESIDLAGAVLGELMREGVPA